jgi:hypothetical protein
VDFDSDDDELPIKIMGSKSKIARASKNKAPAKKDAKKKATSTTRKVLASKKNGTAAPRTPASKEKKKKDAAGKENLVPVAMARPAMAAPDATSGKDNTVPLVVC